MRKTSRVMLVEDDLDHALLVVAYLSKHPLVGSVIHMPDGQQALSYLFAEDENIDPQRELPDLILLDLRLPKIGGLEVLKTIHDTDRLPPIPVVVFSTSDAESDIAEAYRCGANSYLVKPLDYKKFTMVLNDLCQYWLTWNRHAPTPVS